MFDNELSVLVLGRAGAGKSSFGNLLLGEKAFVTGDSVNSVTLEPKSASGQCSGMKINVIDTEGFGDTDKDTDTQTQSLAWLLRNWKKGVNAVTFVLNWHDCRLTTDIRDFMLFAFRSFGNPEFLKYISVVFTRCSEDVKQEARSKRKGEIQVKIKNLLTTAIKKEDDEEKKKAAMEMLNVIEIPVYFIDSSPDKPPDPSTRDNLGGFHCFMGGNPPLPTTGFNPATIGGTIEIERDTVLDHEDPPDSQNLVYGIFHNKKREHFIPDTVGSADHYSEWEVESEDRKAIRRIEKQQDVSEQTQGNQVYRVTVYKQRDVILPLKDGEQEKPGDWKEVNREQKVIRRIETQHKNYEDTTGDTTYQVTLEQEREVVIRECGSEQRGEWKTIRDDRKPIRRTEVETEYNVVKDYRVTGDGDVKYEIRVDRKRTVTIDLISKIRTLGGWDEYNKKEVEVARKRVTKETRPMETEERREISDWVPLGPLVLLGMGVRETHYSYYLITWTEERQKTTDVYGYSTYTEWKEVPGSREEKFLGGYGEDNFSLFGS